MPKQLNSSITQALQHQVSFEQARLNEIQTAAMKGLEFFHRFNESRLDLAFSSFAEEMKHALFEVIFFLHVNDPHFEKHIFTAKRKERINGVLKNMSIETKTNLYVKNAPSGVMGIENLSAVFKEEFYEYIRNTFGVPKLRQKGFAAICSISSLGSIGTIGHKAYKSDLDLQVQYELEPFLVDERNCTDKHLHHFIDKLIKYFAKIYVHRQLKQKTRNSQSEIIHKGSIIGNNTAKKRWPNLYAHFIEKSDKLIRYLGSVNFKKTIADEVITLYKTYSQLIRRKEREAKDQLLKKKIRKIQDYVQAKFPEAEIYLFGYSTEDYRNGQHGTTMDSKESSGSAYELILNYEVLLPGIQFTPVIPMHFLFDKKVNTNKEMYSRFVDYIRFNYFKLHDRLRGSYVDLGPTPRLTREYMMEHSGAVYWESFKASSGNLPKALLNLLRIEMLFSPMFRNTIIEIVKDSDLLDKYINILSSPQKNKAPEENTSPKFKNTKKNGGKASKFPESLPIFELKSFEKEYPRLKFDPWWIKYKALKIGFSPEYSKIRDPDELKLLSRVIDICFALHVRLSDVFTLPKDHTEVISHREGVLEVFLEKAFPPDSPQKKFLQNIFIGDINDMGLFEAGMKRLFKNSLLRVEKILEQYEEVDSERSNRDEFRIWFHYFQSNFEPSKNQIQRNILNQLKNARERIQIEFVKNVWKFRSMQKKAASSPQSADNYKVLSYLPDEVELFQHESFIHGLTHCVLNGYYGTVNKGTMKETKTQIEFVISRIDLGSLASNKWAYLRPEDAEDIVSQINEAFTYQEYDFRDCIKKETVIVDVFFFLNLLRYGQLSIVYRNNLRHWFVDSLYSFEIEKKASTFFSDYEALLKNHHLHRMIAKFLKKHNIKLTSENQQHIFCWLNPNSAKTRHSSNQQKQKEQELNNKFKSILLTVHRHKRTEPIDITKN